MKPFSELFGADKLYIDLRDAIMHQGENLRVVLAASLYPFLITEIFSDLGQPIFVITDEIDTAQRLTKDIRNFLPDSAYFIPDWETLPHERISPGKEIVAERLQALYHLQSGQPIIATTAAQTIMRKIPGKKSPLIEPIMISKGDKVDLYQLLEKLAFMGYERVYRVEARGDFSARGGIVDIFPANSNHPIRIEFFGDEVESLRKFNISSQRSIDQIASLDIFSCREVYFHHREAEEIIRSLKDSSLLEEQTQEDIEKLKSQQYFAGMERYVPFLHNNLASVLDFIPSDCLLVFADRYRINLKTNLFFEQQKEYLAEAVLNGEIVTPPTSFFSPFSELVFDQNVLDFSSQRLNNANERGFISTSKNHIWEFGADPVDPILGKLERLRKLLLKLAKQKFSIIIMVNDKGQAERLKEIFEEWKIESFLGFDRFMPTPGLVQLAVGDLDRGFVLTKKKVALLTHSDIFIKGYKERRFELSESEDKAITPSARAFSDFKRGDYVVHVNHGIAVYDGIVTKEVSGVVRDYLVLKYAGEDKLFVPIDQADRVSKYIGAGPKAPKVHKLTSNEWRRVKRKVKKSVKELAIDLYYLYTRRAMASGVSFSSDTIWQAELEEAFPFEETRGQLEATADVKRDMEIAKPMDRLVCGDVGYGKTEVAMRAAFKATMDEKQVMVLVPTTILSEQHFKTFRSRFAPYPVIIEELSRFRSRNEQMEVIKKFGEGKIDVLIGTHRLLQKDVSARDLGLLIVDEEQRFGVAHKEHLKDLKKSVDVLTLTATPIPRTMQMALSGVRDISIMDTPPENRYPVSTYVGEFSKEIIRNAVRREMSRGGQVYYVHNRVATIAGIANLIQEIVPNACCAVAHGQMSESTLEKIMEDFIQHKYDVLVCTTIIESGIDIPAVNTLIVDRAERLGLSTLYQLRGRVGRAHHQAYAYFFFSRQGKLTNAAHERLKTIGEFTQLGSGLKIALKDLEIRGAGNLLGPEQHGKIADVGFELYCQMLNQAVQEITGDVPEKIEVRIELPISAYIPQSYIDDEVLRTEAYQKLSSTVSLEGVKEAARELEDRYGPLPTSVQNLMDILRLRVLAREKKISNISWERKRLIISPISIGERESIILEKAVHGFFYLSKEQILKIDGLQTEELIGFLFKLFSDIIS